MRGQGKLILGALGIVAFCSGAGVSGAATATEVYGQIPARNLFGLHEPVRPEPEVVKPQLPKIVLTGITTMGSKLAYLKVQHLPKPGEQQGDESLTLTEGQREGGIEILEINEKTGTVRVNNSGTEMTISFDKDAGKIASSPPPGPGPVPTGSPPNIAARIRSMNPGTSGYQRMIPTRTGQQVPATEPTLQNSAVGQGLIQGQNPPVEKPLTPEEQAVLRELERAAQGNQAQPK